MSSFESSQKPEEKNPLHNEHLAEDVRPIMASICDWDNISPDDGSRAVLDDINIRGEFVDYDGSLSAAKRKNMIQPSEGTYVISDCDAKDKFSIKYWNCTGIVLVGTDKESGAQISILTHQNPEKFLGEYEEAFRKDLAGKTAEMVSRSAERSIDAVVFGGNNQYDGLYEESIEMLTRVCKDTLGFEPVVLTGPNMKNSYGEYASIYLDTQNRRLYFVRPAQDGNRTNGSYLPSQLKTERRKWE